ncbi:MAG: hypothetical protein M3N97_11670 [Pseudomonadota bacterium]|nr:hypothetical protein [Pseudomonadota bacterium]
MLILKFSTASLVISFILGCSSQNADPPHVETPALAAPPEKTVFDPLTRQIDRARAVQNTVDQSADRTRDTIDNEEHGGPGP